MISSNKSNIKYYLIFIFIVLVIVSFNEFMGEDEGRFSYMGRIWANNDLPPYSYSIENKTPGIFLLNAISFSLFGTNIFFMRLLGILSLTLSSYIIYKINTYLLSHEAGIVSMLIFGLTMSWRNLDGAFSSYTETFMILFVVLSFFITIKPNFIKNHLSKIFFAGFMMGFAIAFKQIAITSAFALLLFILFYNNKRISLNFLSLIGSYSLGILLGTFISIIPLLFSGVSLMEYINGAWILLLDDGSSPDLVKRFLFARELWFNSRLVFFYPFLLLLILQTKLLKENYFILLVVWLILDFIGVNASGYYFGHQIKQLMPSLSIIIGILIINSSKSLKINNDLNKKYFSRLTITLILLMLPYQILAENYLRLRNSNFIEHYKEIGLFIKANTIPSDYVFMMTNANAVLSYTDRVSASKYFNPLFMNTEKEYQEVLNDLNTKKPKFIVLRKEEKQFIFPESFHQFVAANYFLSDELYGFLIYQSKFKNPLS